MHATNGVGAICPFVHLDEDREFLWREWAALLPTEDIHRGNGLVKDEGHDPETLQFLNIQSTHGHGQATKGASQANR